MPYFPGHKTSPQARELGIALLALLLVVIIVVIWRAERKSHHDSYSVGYQIGPHYLGTSTWSGTPYALTPMRDGEKPCPAPYKPSSKSGFTGGFQPFAPPDEGPRGTDDPAELVYEPPFTRDLRGKHPDWCRPDGGSYGLPPASERPDFWAGDATLHTYHARDIIPPLCEAAEVADGKRRPTLAENVEKWQYYGGPKGWNMSPYY